MWQAWHRHVRHVVLDRNGALVVVGDITDAAAAATTAGAECGLFDGGSQPRTVLEGDGVPVAGSLIEAVAMAMG